MKITINRSPQLSTQDLLYVFHFCLLNAYHLWFVNLNYFFEFHFSFPNPNSPHILINQIHYDYAFSISGFHLSYLIIYLLSFIPTINSCNFSHSSPWWTKPYSFPISHSSIEISCASPWSST